MKPLVYLAGPMTGLKFDKANDWRLQVNKDCALAGIDCVSPMRGKQNLKNGEIINPSYRDRLSNPMAIVTRDYFDVARATAIFVNFLGSTTISIGTVAEMAWAYMMHKPVIVAMEKDSLYAAHPFMLLFARFVERDLESATQLLIEVVKGGVE
jgi:hypothetical protein